MSTKSLKNQLLAAIAMVLVATIALGSSTYAWFVNNGTVKAEGMKVQIQSEQGIEIAFVNDDGDTGDYSTTASAGMTTTPANLMATSTADTLTWYHTHASSAASYAKDPNAEYAELGIKEKNGVGTATLTDPDEEGAFYLVKKFNIRSASVDGVASKLHIDNVTVSGGTAALDQSIRVAIKVGETDAQLFNPLGGTGSITVNGTTSLTYETSTDVDSAYDGTIDRNGVDVLIYVYFEGEDENLKSANLTTELNQLDVSVQFTATVEATT